MTTQIDEVIKRHRELTAEKASMAARHAEEINPISDKIDVIEKWLLAKQQAEGVQNYKTDFGTAYQSKLTNVKCDDPIAFRDFILTPCVENILDIAIGLGAQGVDKSCDVPAMLRLIGTTGLWDIVDLKPGKKGVQKYIEETQKTVPGVTVSQYINLNVKGS